MLAKAINGESAPISAVNVVVAVRPILVCRKVYFLSRYFASIVQNVRLKCPIVGNLGILKL